MKKLLWKSYAKINIYLDVLKTKRDDHYHNLDMIMLPIELHDSLLLTELANSKDNYITMDEYSLSLDTDKNLAKIALDRFVKKYKTDKKATVFIHKRIPLKSGLGGGSSDGANVMLAFAKMFKIETKDEDLYEICNSLGSDVAFFLKSVPARCEGRGEILTPINIKKQYYLVLVMPENGCSTKEIYKELQDTDSHPSTINNALKALETGDDELLANSIHNDLEGPAIRKIPEIANIKNELSSLGLKIVMMTGSGSCVFGMTQDKKLAKKITKKLEKKYRVFFTKTINSRR